MSQTQLFQPPLSTPQARVRGRMHRYPQDTERAAALAIQPKTGTARMKVLAYVANKGYRGACDFEIERGLAMRRSSVCGRRNELVKGGWLIDSGERRQDPQTRMKAIVWVLSRRGQKELRL